MPSPAKLTFDQHLKDVEQLRTLHQVKAGPGPGRKHGVEVLNRAVIVFICACWEAYVEDVLRDSMRVLLTHAGAAHTEHARLNQPLEHALDAFHAPNTRAVNNLIEGLLGLPNISKAWKWPGARRKVGGAPISRSQELDALVKMRGRIAHRVTGKGPIGKAQGTQAIKLAKNLVRTTDNAVAGHVAAIVGTAPW